MDTNVVAIDVMKANIDVLGEINQQQLYAGKRRDGLDLFPTYQNDPYFDSPEAAQRYSDWKDRITPNPKRRPGVPNLFINGYYYSRRTNTISGDKIVFDNDYIDLAEKYGDEINGLGGEYKIEFKDLFLMPAFKEEIKKLIGLKFP